MFDELMSASYPPQGGHEEWGRSEAPTPTDLILRGWGQRVGASEGGRQAGRPAVRPKPRRLVPHARLHITGHGEAKAGARAAGATEAAMREEVAGQ